MLGVSLAAGFGTRLKPFTESMPKAAIPFMGIPSLYFPLKKFNDSGVADVCINAHHHVEQTKSLVLHQPFGDLNVNLSVEKEILGSGGAYPRMLEYISDDGLISYNADIISSIDLEEFQVHIQKEKPYASLIVLERKGCVGVKKGLIESFHSKDGFYGAGVFYLSKQCVLDMPKGSCELIPHLTKHLDQKITAFTHRGYWTDIGDSPQSIFDAHVDVFHNDLIESLGIPGMTELCGFSLTKTDDSVYDSRSKCEMKKISNSFVFNTTINYEVHSSLIFKSIPSGSIKNKILMNGSQFDLNSSK